jgi:hypothetical protein
MYGGQLAALAVVRDLGRPMTILMTFVKELKWDETKFLCQGQLAVLRGLIRAAKALRDFSARCRRVWSRPGRDHGIESTQPHIFMST